jgi:transcriptional regulator GlxA family with amidase domain
MKRREFMHQSASIGVVVAAGSLMPTWSLAATAGKLTPPAKGKIPVAFAISEGVTVIDFAGPWEVFQDVHVVPDYTFETTPQPKVVVVPAQRGSKALHAWLQKMTASADVIMSVCTGAFQLGRAGLLAGKEATTHHDFLDQFAKAFPDVTVKRGLRFVEEDKISTAGGLSSGIDLALRVVDRYFGRGVAQATATYMEYQSKGWIV